MSEQPRPTPADPGDGAPAGAADATPDPDGSHGPEAPIEPEAPPEPEAPIEPEAPPGPEVPPEPSAAAEPAPSDLPRVRARRRRDPLSAALIGVLTLLLGFAIAVQVRHTDTDQQLSGAREEDLVGILDELNAEEDRLRQQIAEQRSALSQLTGSDSRQATALQEAQRRAEAIGILNGTVAAQGPGLRMLIRDPGGAVRVADLLDAVEELRGAGAETMQIDDVRIGVSSAVTGEPGALAIDGRPITAPYEVLVIGSPQDLETAMNIPGGVVQKVGGRGGSVEITQSQRVVVDALRPLDVPQYASPESDGG